MAYFLDSRQAPKMAPQIILFGVIHNCILGQVVIRSLEELTGAVTPVGKSWRHADVTLQVLYRPTASCHYHMPALIHEGQQHLRGGISQVNSTVTHGKGLEKGDLAADA
jgi:hypothetical protein